MKYFVNINDVTMLRKIYKELLKKYHPDNDGDVEIMQQINAEYDEMLKRLESGGDFNTTKTDAMRIILEKVCSFDCDIEICGTWIWAGGNTYPYKDNFKALGFRWSRSKKMWYWHEGGYRKFSKRKTSMSYIRGKYGSETVNESQRKIG